MKVKDIRMSFGVSQSLPRIILRINGLYLTTIYWDYHTVLKKPQAIAIAKRLCDRFNAGQEGK